MKAWGIEHLEELKQAQQVQPQQLQLELDVPTYPEYDNSEEKFDSEVSFEVDFSI